MKLSVISCIELRIVELKSEIKMKENTEYAVEIPDDIEELNDLQEEIELYWGE